MSWINTIKNRKNKILIAVSGGPDSMALLHKYSHKKNIIVAHVNYQKRTNANDDEKIVRFFCKEFYIPFYTKKVKYENEYGNFQDWARKQRYDFFKTIYKQENCKLLLIAHHNDDFVETALMEQRSNRMPDYFGIKKHNDLIGMNISRPFINKYWKNELLNYCNKHDVLFGIDYTNNDPKYTRNKIRQELAKKSIKDKKNILQWFKMANKILDKKNRKINYLFGKWSKSEFDLKFWRKLYFYKHELLFKFIHKDNLGIKLSSKKLENISTFLEKDTQSKAYKLNNKYNLHKMNGKLKISSVV